MCFITVAGFLNGPGFQQMRAYLRETCDDIWVIDCSPEGHQPEVNTRIFQGVQQPVCIVMASRSGKKTTALGAVHFQSLPKGKREHKFVALKAMRLADKTWIACPDEARAPFLPASTGAWSDFPRLEDLFLYNGSGVQTKRTWVIAPDSESLSQRWAKLISAAPEKKEELFHPTLRDGLPADRHIASVVREALPGYGVNLTKIADEKSVVVTPLRYGFRSFDRQWIIPDVRVITQPNARLWQCAGGATPLFLTAFCAHIPTSGPALTFTGLTPDLHHYKGSFGGRVFPLWADATTESNVRSGVLSHLTAEYKKIVTPEDLVSYVAALAAHPAYTSRFQPDLSTPGLRIPFTSEGNVFEQAVTLGRTVIWLHTFGERMVDPEHGRPAEPPRLPKERRPGIPKAGSISQAPEDMPDTLGYDAGKHQLLVGHGFIDNVTPAMWAYEVSGKQVLTQWFSYRKRNRERPIIGDRRKPSALGDIQPDHWLPEYTTELLNVLNVLGLLIDLEPQQAELLERVCVGPLISASDLKSTEGTATSSKPKHTKKAKISGTASLF